MFLLFLFVSESAIVHKKCFKLQNNYNHLSKNDMENALFNFYIYIYLVLSFQVIFLHSPTIEVPTYYCLNINHIGLEFKKLCTEVRWNRLMLVSKKILMSLTYFKGFKVPHVNNIKHSLSKGFSSLCTLVMVRKTTYSSLFMITWTHLELYKRIHPRVL